MGQKTRLRFTSKDVDK